MNNVALWTKGEALTMAREEGFSIQTWNRIFHSIIQVKGSGWRIFYAKEDAKPAGVFMDSFVKLISVLRAEHVQDKLEMPIKMQGKGFHYSRRARSHHQHHNCKGKGAWWTTTETRVEPHGNVGSRQCWSNHFH